MKIRAKPEQEQEQPVEATTAPVETKKERLIRETEEAELELKHRKATKQLKECQDCEALQKTSQELAGSLAERESELVRQVEALAAANLKLQEREAQVKNEAAEVARIKATNDKATNFVANLAIAQRADSMSLDLKIIDQFICANQPKGVHSPGVVKLPPEKAAFRRIEQLLTERKITEGG